MRREAPDRQRHQRKPRSDGRGQWSAYTRYRIDLNSGLNARLHYLCSRIRNTRRSGVGDQRDGLSALKPGDQLRKPCSCVVLVKTDGRCRNGVSRQKPGRAPCILGGDHLNVAQDPQRTQRDVLEVADWRCDDEQSARHVGVGRPRRRVSSGWLLYHRGMRAHGRTRPSASMTGHVPIGAFSALRRRLPRVPV